MSRAPRLIGYVLLAASLVLLAAGRGNASAAGLNGATVAAIFLIGIGLMLVFTDLMVRGIYAQIDRAPVAGVADADSAHHGDADGAVP